MAAPEDRAGDLLDRLADCELGDGMSEDDLLGSAVREPLRSCCIKLAARLWALCQRAGLGDPKALQAATVAVRRAANTEASASEGRLDGALVKLAQTVDPTFPPGTRLEAVELLVAVLQAATMSAAQQEQEVAAAGVEMPDSELAPAADVADDMDTTDHLAYQLSAALRAIASLLQLEPAASVGTTAAELAAAVLQQVQQLLARLPAGFFEPLLPAGSLGEMQLATLSEVDAALRSEYALRRRMLIERVKVTLQSFMWSPRLESQGTKADAQGVVDAAARAMSAEPAVVVADVFAATLADLLAILEKATSGETGIHASVKGVLIGKVPDRGGRPEGRKREADMPAWTARKVTQGGGGKGGGGRGGGGGWGGGGKGKAQI